MTELLLGCGYSRAKHLALPGRSLEWSDLVTLDYNLRCIPDIVADLDVRVWRTWDELTCTPKGREFVDGERSLKPEMFDEVHAYEVLEHLGQQGDAGAFFDTFGNIHRILKPGGHLFATCPSRYSAWAWGDPSHRRIISQESLTFLSQKVIAKNRAAGTQMSDFLDLWTLDFDIVASEDNHRYHTFCLRAVK